MNLDFDTMTHAYFGLGVGIVCIIICIMMLIIHFCLNRSDLAKPRKASKVALFILISFSGVGVIGGLSGAGFWIYSKVALNEYEETMTLYSTQGSKELFIIENKNGDYIFSLNENGSKEHYCIPNNVATIYYSGVSVATMHATKEKYKSPVVEIILPHETIIM